MAQLKVKPKIDIAFKKIFADNEELLKGLISAALELQNAKKITLKPNEVTPARVDEKFCRLDIRAEVDGIELDIEIQLLDRDDFKTRSEYYSSLLFAHLKKGKSYNKIPKTVLICIVDFEAFPNYDDYHSCFVPMERTRHEILTDKKEIHYFELKKIAKIKNAQKEIEHWLKLIAAETESDIAELEKNTSNEKIQSALVEVQRLNKDTAFIREVEAREIQLYEEQSALEAAKVEGRAEGELKKTIEMAKTILKLGYLTIEQISETTGLTIEEIEALAKK